MNNKDNKIIEVRFIINPQRDTELFKMFNEIADYFPTVKHYEIAKMCIEKAYKKWFLKDIKK